MIGPAPVDQDYYSMMKIVSNNRVSALKKALVQLEPAEKITVGRSNENLHKWSLTDSASCSCGVVILSYQFITLLLDSPIPVL